MRLVKRCVVLIFLAASVYGQDAPNLALSSPAASAVFVREDSIPLNTLTTSNSGVFHAIGYPLDSYIATLERFRLIGYTPLEVYLEPGKHRLYTVTGDELLTFEVDLGTKKQQWNLHPTNPFVQETVGLLGVYGALAIPFAVSPTYVDVVHGKGFGPGAIVLTTATAALGLAICVAILNAPSVSQTVP